MSKKKIITYLKDNRVKGVAFDFMPRKVQDWCSEHRDEKIFSKFVNGGWLTTKIAIHCDLDSIYCLSEDYESEPEFKPHWEEFEIDKGGFFHIKKWSDIIYYHWFNWQKFLGENFDKYNNFGGWLCADGKWRTYPPLHWHLNDVECYNGTCGDNCEPVMPTKIRFWRNKK